MKFETAKDSYDDPQGAENHLRWLGSKDGEFFQQVLSEAFTERLGDNTSQKILDLACGNGWLSAKLNSRYPNIEGLDGSKPFLDVAKNSFPDIKFTYGDLNSSLPYDEAVFDTVIFSMAAHDVEDELHTFKQIYKILKPGGRLMISIVNPYYAYPAMSWKRSWLDVLLSRYPKPKLTPYHILAHQDRSFTFNKTVQSYFVKLEEHFNRLHEAGFKYSYMKELESTQDSPEFGMQYKLHRFPVLLYIEMTKPS